MSSGDLDPPAARTSRLHAQRAREHLGWHQYTPALEQTFQGWLKPLAAERDHGSFLLEALLRHLYRRESCALARTRWNICQPNSGIV